MPSFGVSIALLSLLQGALVALPGGRAWRLPQRLRSSLWALVPALSIVAVILAIRAASQTAQALSWLALVAVPPLAAAALGWGMRGARPWLALLAGPLLATAWLDRGGLAGEGAAVVLTALACVSLAMLSAALAPARWLKGGIVVAALVDSAFVISDLLTAPNAVLNAASPGPGLPQLQRAVFGSAVVGFGDLFVAALLGAVYAADPRLQRGAALCAAALALLFDLLFLFVDELPATVPTAVTLLLFEGARRSRGSRAGR